MVLTHSVESFSWLLIIVQVFLLFEPSVNGKTLLKMFATSQRYLRGSFKVMQQQRLRDTAHRAHREPV